MIKKLLIKYFPGALIVLSLSGCLSVPNVVETPRISVQDVVLQDVSLARSTALIRVSVNNPNRFPLPLRGVQYGLSLNGRQVAQGRQVQQRNINALETVSMDIPVQMNLSELLHMIPSILLERRVQYDLQGAVNLPFISIPFSRRGGAGV